MKLRNMISTICITAGVILVVSAVGLIGYNTYVEKQANSYSNEMIASLKEEIQKAESLELDVQEAGESEKSEIGDAYIGILSIPSLELELPIARAFSYTQLKVTPCAYRGSVEEDNLAIAGHNYKVHFKYLDQLNNGDIATFLDTDGMVHEYEVIGREIVAEEKVEVLEEEADLTLFTCNIKNNTQRIVVRFQKIAPTELNT